MPFFLVILILSFPTKTVLVLFTFNYILLFFHRNYCLAVRRVKGRLKMAWRWCSVFQRELMMPCIWPCWRVNHCGCTKISLFICFCPNECGLDFFWLPLSSLRVRREPGGAGRAHPAGQFSGLGSSLADPKGKRPTPLPLWVLTGLQQRDKGLSRQNQVPVQDQTTGGCSAGLFWAISIMFMLKCSRCVASGHRLTDLWCFIF